MRCNHARYRREAHAIAYAKYLSDKQQDATFQAVPDPMDPFYFHAIRVTFPSGKTAYAARTYGWRYRSQRSHK